MKTTLLLAGMTILAACSRNPRPNTDETGRADTMTTDPAWVPRIDTAKWDTLRPVPRRTDTMPTPRWPDTTGRDTVPMPGDTMPMPGDSMPPPRDSTPMPGDTIRVPADTAPAP